jgi:hypothetical protein
MLWNEKRLLKVTGHFVPGTLYFTLDSDKQILSEDWVLININTVSGTLIMCCLF